MRKLIITFAFTFAVSSGMVFAAGADINEPTMIRIVPGNFIMGSDTDWEGPAHPVKITYAFEIAKTEVTQGQWKAVMGDNPSHFNKCGDDCPVEQVSYEDAISFIKQLNQRTGKQYRLPSEAEWEYACLGGSEDKYCGGDDIVKVGWHKGNSGGKPNSVGRKKSNMYGLYDMSGNVWEWTQDCWNENHIGAPVDGSARATGDCSKRVIRGVSWFDDASNLRVSIRSYLNIDLRHQYFGFRIARSVP
jgi:formylglycine-generating enzyme required for sulfatase activity